MKRLDIYTIMFLSIFIVFAFVSCNDDNQTVNKQALTENDFFNDPNLRANPEEGVLITFLENPMSESEENDTGQIGEDIIPITYANTTNQTFCWEDDDQEAEHFMTLIDIEGIEVLSVVVNGDCVTQTIEAGDYEIHLNHDGRIEDTLPIFLINQEVDVQSSNLSETGFFNESKKLFYKMFQNLSYTEIVHAQEGEPVANLRYLIINGECFICDLEGVDLSGACLFNNDLRSAFLRNANLSRTDLGNANLGGAVLVNANLTGAFLNGANLVNADLSGATWIDGETVCEINSIGCCRILDGRCL